MPILPYILRKEQRFGTKLSRIRLIITLFTISQHSQLPSSYKFGPFVSLQLILRSGCADHNYYYEKYIESTKRLIYFIIENNVAPSYPRQIYCFNLSSLNMRHWYCFDDFSGSWYHNIYRREIAYIILLTCIWSKIIWTKSLICAFETKPQFYLNLMNSLSQNLF